MPFIHEGPYDSKTAPIEFVFCKTLLRSIHDI